MQKWLITVLNNPIRKLLVAYTSSLRYNAPSVKLRFLSLSLSRSSSCREWAKTKYFFCYLFSFFSSSSSSSQPLLIRLGTYLFFLFFSFFSTSIAGVFLVCICQKRRRKKVFIVDAEDDVDAAAAAAVDNNNSSRCDSRPRLVVIFFIPELLLAKSCQLKKKN